MIRWLLIGILLLVIARAFWRLMDGVIEALGGTRRTRRAANESATRLMKDPVCGTHVSPSSAITLAAGGQTHYFCSETCRDRYKRSA